MSPMLWINHSSLLRLHLVYQSQKVYGSMLIYMKTQMSEYTYSTVAIENCTLLNLLHILPNLHTGVICDVHTCNSELTCSWKVLYIFLAVMCICHIVYGIVNDYIFCAFNNDMHFAVFRNKNVCNVLSTKATVLFLYVSWQSLLVICSDVRQREERSAVICGLPVNSSHGQLVTGQNRMTS